MQDNFKAKTIEFERYKTKKEFKITGSWIRALEGNIIWDWFIDSSEVSYYELNCLLFWWLWKNQYQYLEL